MQCTFLCSPATSFGYRFINRIDEKSNLTYCNMYKITKADKLLLKTDTNSPIKNIVRRGKGVNSIVSQEFRSLA